MKRSIVFVFFVLSLLTLKVPSAAAQYQPATPDLDHGLIGVFADYFRLSQTSTNFAGVGARLGLNANRYLSFEAEAAYDFDQAFAENFTNNGTGTVTVNRSDLRILHGLFGPVLSTGHGPIRAFVTVKGGGIDFNLDNSPATFGTFASSVSNIRASNVDALLYPGGGIEAHVGPIGLRLDAGDEIYFASGAHHNLRLTFGPIFRF
jgi:hypothetical protein